MLRTLIWILTDQILPEPVTTQWQFRNTSAELEVSDATNFQEEDTDGDPPDVIYNNSEESHGYDDFPQDIQNHTTEQNQITLG